MFSPRRALRRRTNRRSRACWEIYVQTFPAGGKWQVSNSGGSDPSWSADGKELYYRSPDQKLMAVEIRVGGDFQAGVPQALFPIRIRPGNPRNKYAPFARRPTIPGRRAAWPATP